MAEDPAREQRIKMRSKRYLPLRCEIEAPTLLALREYLFKKTGSRNNNYVTETVEKLLKAHLESEGVKIESQH